MSETLAAVEAELAKTRRVIAYDRVSTTGQGDTGYGQEAQRSQIAAYITYKGWEIVGYESDIQSSTRRRPGLERAIERIESGEADVLMAAKLSRLSRSLLETSELFRRARENKWDLVALDLQIDTTNPVGELLMRIMASINEYERKMISERTKDGLQAALVLRNRRPSSVVTTREEEEVPAEAVRRCGSLRAAADDLNARGIPTPPHVRRQHWDKWIVKRMVDRAASRDRAEAAIYGSSRTAARAAGVVGSAAGDEVPSVRSGDPDGVGPPADGNAGVHEPVRRDLLFDDVREDHER